MSKLKMTLCGLLYGLAALLCSAAVMAEEHIIGMIEAEIEGEPKSWHLLYGEVDATHSAVWMARGDGVNTAVIGGYESPDVEFSVANGIPTVSGAGSALVISFSYQDTGAADPELSAAYPVSLLLMERVGDYSSSRMLEETELEISEIATADDGTGSFSGTFSGTFPAMGSDRPSLVITNGRFDARAVRQALPR